jgi:hypothetical protein
MLMEMRSCLRGFERKIYLLGLVVWMKVHQVSLYVTRSSCIRARTGSVTQRSTWRALKRSVRPTCFEHRS